MKIDMDDGITFEDCYMVGSRRRIGPLMEFGPDGSRFGNLLIVPRESGYAKLIIGIIELRGQTMRDIWAVRRLLRRLTR